MEARSWRAEDEEGWFCDCCFCWSEEAMSWLGGGLTMMPVERSWESRIDSRRGSRRREEEEVVMDRDVKWVRW